MSDDIRILDDHGVIRSMIDEVKAFCDVKGWSEDGRSFGDSMALLISEPIEALEAWRINGLDVWLSYQPTINGVKMPKMTHEQVVACTGQTPEELGLMPRREGVGPELAGTLVRLFDDAHRWGVDIFAEFRAEMDFNWTRAHRHGGKKL